MSEALNVEWLPAANSQEYGIDSVCLIIKRELSLLTWNKNSLGRIKPQVNKEGGLEPWLYKDKGEYYKAYPNDTLDSFSCLYAHDDELFDQEAFWSKRTLSVIVWVNLQKLNLTSIEVLKLNVVQKLRGLHCVMSVNKSVDQTVAGANGVYPGFDMSGFDTKYLTYPFGGFRIETTVHYTNLC